MKLFTHKNNKWLFTLALTLLFTSCRGMHNPAEEEVIQSGKQVSVAISVEEQFINRTAFPQGMDRDSMTIYILSEGETELRRWTKDWDNNISAYSVMQMNPASLSEGNHNLVLTAIYAAQNETDGVVYRGSLENFAVTEGVVLPFTLRFVDVAEAGTGTLKARVECLSFYNSIQYYIYTTTDKKNPGELIYSSRTSATGENNSYYCNISQDLDSGCYILVLEFIADYRSSIIIPTAYAEELFYISDGTISSSTIRFEGFSSIFNIVYYFNDGYLNGSRQTYGKTVEYSPMQDIVLYGYDGTNTVTKNNYTFGGWYYEQDFSGQAVTGWNKYTVSGDKKLYAKWNYAVTFNPNTSLDSPAEGSTESAVAFPGTELTLTKNAFTREGYLFNGWNTMADGSGTVYEDCSKFTAEQNVTLYAQWIARTADKVAVSFRANGGTLEPIQEIDSAALLTEPTSTLTGYDLVNWYTTENCAEGTEVNFATYRPTEDATLYAKWQAQEYSITYYDYKEGETTQAFSGRHQTGYPIKHTYDSVTQLEIPEKTDCSIAGWYTDADCSGTPLTELSATAYLADITLYAKWVRNVYYVSESGSDDAYVDDETAYGDGSSEHPYATFSSVFEDINATGEKVDNIINVSGTITGLVTISLSADNAKSITITGVTGNESDKLDGNYQGTVLTISTAIPVTLKNITVTKGSDYYAGAISLKYSNAVLTLEEGTLIKGNRGSGRSYSCSNCILIDSDGTLIMEEGAEISENIRYSNGGDYGGGVTVYNGKFIMNGGSISNNQAYYGGGVFIYQTGTFEMNGGSITNNSANSGGGVYNNYGKFTMNAGEISENTLTNNNEYGAGVYTSKKSSDAEFVFIMNGGSICNNNGNGVYIYNNSNSIANDTFTMNGGSICNNNGNGVYSYRGTFTMNAGVISGNHTSNKGGGLYNDGSFTLNGGSITDNTVTNQSSNEYGGGGIYYVNNYYNSFVMNGGEISGNTAKYGAAIYLNKEFSMGADAYIPAGADGKQDIYFANSNIYIGVSNALTSPAPLAKVTITSPAWGTSIISPASGISIADMFELTPYEDEPWFINDEGKLDSPKYSIIYKDRGNNDFTADNLSELPSEHQYGVVTTLVKPVRDGYEFIGWYKDPECFDSLVTSIAEKEITDEITLYARWTEKSVNIQIVNSDISITKTDDDGRITLTAAGGFSDYLWLIGNTPAQNVITGSSVSEDGKTFTFSTENLMQGKTYTILVSALRGSTEYSTTIQVKK